MDSFDQIIESDFDVKLLCQHDAGSLFYAFKNEAVHFITHVNNVLDQCYVTRFELAMGFNYLEQFAEIGSHRYEFAKKPDFKLSHDASQGDRYIMHWGEHEFVLDNEGGSGDFFNAVNEDLVAYRECYDQLDNLSEEEIVNRYFTDEILPYSLSVETIHSVMPVVFGQLLPQKDNGEINVLNYKQLWSRCNHGASQPTDAYLKGLVRQLNAIKPSDLSNDLRLKLENVQSEVFSEGLWQDQMKSDNDVLTILREGLMRLNPCQRAVLDYLEECSGIFFLLNLGFAIGAITERTYVNAAAGAQPDSEEVQALLYDLAVCAHFLEMNDRGHSAYCAYSAEAPGEDGSPLKRMFFDPCFLTARHQAAEWVKAAKAKNEDYSGVKLALLFKQLNDNNDTHNDYAINAVELLTGERMHTEEVLRYLDTEAAVLRHNCGLSFPENHTIHVDQSTYITVNQHFSALYYFTA